MKTFIPLIIIIALFFLQGCSRITKADVLKEEMRGDYNISKDEVVNKPGIEIIEVSAENFHIDKSVLPDREIIKHVKILGAQLNDVISLLTEATHQDIIFQMQSDTLAGNTEEQLRKSKVYVSASDIGFGRLLKKTVGNKLSMRYGDGTYYLGNIKTASVKIPSISGLDVILQKTLVTLGALNVVYDAITSSITFSAKENDYQVIMNYLEILRNNLYMIEYDIAIYSVELNDNYNLGINWDAASTLSSDFNFVAGTATSVGSAVTGAPAATFGALFKNKDYSISMIADMLTQFGKVESIQRPRLLGIAGTDVSLIDGLEEPYIASLTSTAVGDYGIHSTTTAGSAISGLKVTLNSNVMDGTVLTEIKLEINDIVGYADFEVEGGKFSQPKIQKKTINNSMRVVPGKPIIISGLFRHKANKGYKGIPGIADTSAKLLAGSEYEGTTKSEMVIIVTPRVIKYVMK